MLDEDLAQSLIDVASKHRPLLAEVRLEERQIRQVAVRAGEVSSVNSSRDAGMNVRIVLPSGIGFAASNVLSRTEGLRLVKRALSQAKCAGRRSPVTLSEETPVRTRWDVAERVKLRDVSVEDKVARLRGIDAAVVSTKIKVQGRYYELIDWEVNGLYVNSEGSNISSHIPRMAVSSYNLVSANGETEPSMREWGASGGWEAFDGWHLEEVLPTEVRMLKNQLEKGRRVKPGRYDLVCGPEVMGIAAHESCGHPMEADRILGREMSQAGRSFVSPEMIGTRIGSDRVTVIDDPTVPGTYGFYLYDHEGVRARPRLLYKSGKINEFLHNRESAARLGVTSNGSSRAESYMREPIVRMGNTFVQPGDFLEDELFGSVREGVLMHSFTEWNIDDKRYNQKYVSREAYFIKDGEVAGPARRCTLEITTPGFWNAVDAVSKKVEFFAGECGKGDPLQGMTVTMGGPMARLRQVVLR